MPITLANKISISRILLAPFFIMSLMYYSPEKDFWRYIALAVFVAAAATDLADGYVARRMGQKTSLGGILDPLADKVLMISAFICLYKIRGLLPDLRFPAWLVVTAVSRDLILLAGSALIIMRHGFLCIDATGWGKTSTLLQVAALSGMLLQWPASRFLWGLVIVFTVISGLDYLSKGARLLSGEVEDWPRPADRRG